MAGPPASAFAREEVSNVNRAVRRGHLWLHRALSPQPFQHAALNPQPAFPMEDPSSGRASGCPENKSRSKQHLGILVMVSIASSAGSLSVVSHGRHVRNHAPASWELCFYPASMERAVSRLKRIRKPGNDTSPSKSRQIWTKWPVQIQPQDKATNATGQPGAAEPDRRTRHAGSITPWIPRPSNQWKAAGQASMQTRSFKSLSTPIARITVLTTPLNRN